MFIICPKCSAKYRIPEGISLENGQKMKCSACGYIFMKGEEAPLLLEESTRQAPSASQSEPTVSEAFSTPLYTQPTGLSETVPADSLPEAFQPVEATEKKTHIWVVLLYLVVIVGLCIAGWTYRDLLKPTLGDFLSTPAHKVTRSRPITQTRVEKKSQKKSPVVSEFKKSTKPQVVANPEQPKEEKEAEKPVEKTQIVEEQKPIVIAPIGAPNEIVSPAETNEPIPENSTLDEAIEEIQIPLFNGPEEIEETTLNINKISFQVKSDETGNQQLLVEGLIQNDGKTNQAIFPLTVQVFNKAGQLLAEKKIHVDIEQLSPGQAIPFYTGITPVPAEIGHVDVKL